MRTVFAASLLLALSSPAFAHQCPSLMAQIDEKVAAASLSEADGAKVAELRKQGEELHAAGKHDESEAALQEALGMLD
jgi:hypothetical protein